VFDTGLSHGLDELEGLVVPAESFRGREGEQVFELADVDAEVDRRLPGAARRRSWRLCSV